MSEVGDLKCSCQHCGGNIEYPPEAAGMALPCPHCGLTTGLLPQEPEVMPTPVQSTAAGNRKAWLILMALLFLVAVAAGGGWLVQKRDSKSSAIRGEPRTHTTPSRPPKSSNDLNVASIGLEKTGGSGLVYATGEVKNNSDYQRFGVKIELELVDSRGLKVGTATDYTPLIEPRGVWHFKALVLEPKTGSARLAGLTEEE